MHSECYVNTAISMLTSRTKVARGKGALWTAGMGGELKAFVRSRHSTPTPPLGRCRARYRAAQQLLSCGLIGDHICWRPPAVYRSSC